MWAFSTCRSTALLLLLLLLCTPGIGARLLRQAGDDGSDEDGSGGDGGLFGSLDDGTIDGSDSDFDDSNIDPDIDGGSQGGGMIIADSTSTPISDNEGDGGDDGSFGSFSPGGNDEDTDGSGGAPENEDGDQGTAGEEPTPSTIDEGDGSGDGVIDGSLEDIDYFEEFGSFDETDGEDADGSEGVPGAEDGDQGTDDEGPTPSSDNDGDGSDDDPLGIGSFDGTEEEDVDGSSNDEDVTGCYGSRSRCYNKLCVDSADYLPSHNYTDVETGVTNTCNDWLDYFSSQDEDSPIFGEDFGQEWSCEGASPSVRDFVQGVAQAAGCCGENGRSACWADYGHVCQDPGDYLPSHTSGEDYGNEACDTVMSYITNDAESPLFGVDFSQEWNCKFGTSPDARMAVQMMAQSYGCCGENGRSACWQDYSHVCQDPADYLPSHTFIDGGGTCDAVMISISGDAESTLFGVDFSQEWSCDGASDDARMTIQMMAQSYGCCGENGRSACWEDYSHVCQDPADYLPSYANEDYGNTACDAIMSYVTGDAESPLFGIDFSQEWSCDGDSPDVKRTIQEIAQSYGCCGENGRSACWEGPSPTAGPPPTTPTVDSPSPNPVSPPAPVNPDPPEGSGNGVDERGCNVALRQTWCNVHRECVRDWTSAGCDFSCPGATAPGGWGVATQAESTARVAGAVDFALEYLDRASAVYSVEFACTHEISGALAGTFFYSIVDLENGDRIHATVYQKTSTGLYSITEIYQE